MKRLQYPGSLHNHDDYSNLRLRDCIIKYNELIDYAIELGHEVVAITNHEAVCDAIKVNQYYLKKKKENPNLNFKVILGNEIYLCRNGLNADNFVRGKDRYYHFILLAKDKIGHEQIRELSTRAWMRSYMARGMRRVPTYYQDLFDIIGKNPGHVVASSGCLGSAVDVQLLNYRDTQDKELYNKIITWCTTLQDLFGKGNFFLEMQPSDSKDQIYVNNELLKLSKNLDIPFIITDDAHYLRKEDRSIHKAYLNSQNGDREVDDFYATTYLMSTEELESYMRIPDEDIQIAYRNIRKIKDMCEDYDLTKPLHIPSLDWDKPTVNEIPPSLAEKIPYLTTFYESEYESDKTLSLTLVDKINEKPDLQNDAAMEEINECLKMTWVSSEVNKSRWSAYFLNLQKIVEECWNAGTLVGCGRGSGVGFILLYALGITQINPLREKSKTKRWRFLNPDRVSPLD